MRTSAEILAALEADKILRVVDVADGEPPPLAMCGQCVGRGRLRYPGTKVENRCPACHGVGVR